MVDVLVIMRGRRVEEPQSQFVVVVDELHSRVGDFIQRAAVHRKDAA